MAEQFNFENIILEYGNKDITAIPGFLIDSGLRKMGIPLSRDTLQQLRKAHSSLKKGTTLTEFLDANQEISEKLINFFAENKNGANAAEEFTCNKCGFNSQKVNVCPFCG